MEIVLCKQTDAKLEGAQADAVRSFLFGHIDGCNDKDKKAWRRFIRALHEAGPGEYFTIKIERQRNSKFHRLSFAVMTAAFKAQEVFQDFDLMRQYLKIGAGFVSYIPDEITGEWKAIPKSQNFGEASEEEVREFFTNMCVFMRGATCCAALWPNSPIESSMQGMEQILRKFDYE